MNEPVLVNDVHAQLNPTRVLRIVEPTSTDEVCDALAGAARDGSGVSLCGHRHAMGGQQFGEGTVLLDLRRLTAIAPLDATSGTVEIGAGIAWPALIAALHEQQRGKSTVLTIRQKQTGADLLSLGGALSANIHGRGLRMAPMIGDVEAFTIVCADGSIRRCSRGENHDLFRLAIGGYGCFGVITSICLRLTPRRKVARHVSLIDVGGVPPAFAQRIADGFIYGDFQFTIDARSTDFLKRGVLSCYRPIDDDAPISESQRELRPEDWERLLLLAHTDPSRGFTEYAAHYVATDGQRYWSDTHQFGTYLDGYHDKIDAQLRAIVKATEMITELYVPCAMLGDFMEACASELKARKIPLIYGTVRLVEADTESFLPWAPVPRACIIFNLHVEHSPAGIACAADAFRALIDVALGFDGSFYLTYHRWARPDQIVRAYPGIREFLAAKERHDPHALFQSEWWRHLRSLFPPGTRDTQAP